jgi:integrase
MKKRTTGRREGWSNHKGVALLKRSSSGGVRWLVRFTDPDSGKRTHETIPEDRCRTEGQRATFAAEKAAEIKKRAGELQEGAARKKNMTLRDAVEDFFKAPPTALRPGTVIAYRAATNSMLTWAEQRRIELADDLRAESISNLRAWLVNRPALVPNKGEGIGRKSKLEGESKRSVASINSDFRRLKTVLQELRRRGHVPMLRLEGIVDGLRALPEPRRKAAPLEPAEMKKIIGACARHDGECFTLTRQEKADGDEGGTTARYAPILPFVSVVLLSGMRRGEALKLRWDAVDFSAGKIRLGAEAVEKTGHERDVDLSVSPLLTELLTRMKVAAGGSPTVFTMSPEEVESARKILFKKYGSPHFAWSLRKQPLGAARRPTLRATCGTYLVNSNVFDSAAPYRESRQLGHSVAVAERHYLGLVKVDPKARTLEAAMGIEKELRDALGLGTKKGRREAQ